MQNAAQNLAIAQQKAKELFETVNNCGLIIPGKSESELSAEIVSLALELGITDYWHKKIVRAGANTICTFDANPANRIIEDDDIVFLDFGPIYNGWEADLGRTYVVGNNPIKLKLKNDVEEAWHIINKWYHQQDELTGAACYEYIETVAKSYGWQWGGGIGGHIVGPYPHEQPNDPADLCLDIHPANHNSILLPDKLGNKRHWILELHFVDKENTAGAFFEQLLYNEM